MILHCVLAVAALTTLPDTPTPKPVVAVHQVHRSRLWLAETAVLGGLYAADFTLTARGLGGPCNNWPGCRNEEGDPLYGRHPSNMRIAVTAAAIFAGESLLLRQTERSRHKWVRWGGRAFFAYTVADEIRCIRTWRR